MLTASAEATWSQHQGDAGHTGYAATNGIPLQTIPTWTYKTINFKDPTPAVQFTPGIASDGTNVFVSWVGSPSTINGVNSLRISDGSEVWEWMFQGNDAESISAPAFGNGKLYVHRWGHSSSCGVSCNDKPRLFGISANNGQQLFDQVHSGQWSSGGRPTPDGGQVYVAGGYYGGLDNYNGTSGGIQWFASMPQEYGWVPAATGDRVFTSFNGNLTVVNKTTGTAQTLLAPSGGGYGSSTPTVVNDHEAYVPWSSVITQFDPANKYATWEYKPASSYIVNNAIAIGPVALYVNFGNAVKALNRQTGAFMWEWIAPVSLSSNVVLTNSHFYVGNSSQTFAVNLATHSSDWSAMYGGELAVEQNFLFVSTRNALHAFALAVPEPLAISLLLGPIAWVATIRPRRYERR